MSSRLTTDIRIARPIDADLVECSPYHLLEPQRTCNYAQSAILIVTRWGRQITTDNAAQRTAKPINTRHCRERLINARR